MLCLFTGVSCYLDVKGILPGEYKLTIEPDFKSFTFQGEVSIEFSIVNATKQLNLSARYLKKGEIKLKYLNALKTSEINIGFMENSGSWLLFTIEDLVGNYMLDISFTGHLYSVKVDGGFFHDTYIDSETDK